MARNLRTRLVELGFAFICLIAGHVTSALGLSIVYTLSLFAVGYLCIQAYSASKLKRNVKRTVSPLLSRCQRITNYYNDINESLNGDERVKNYTIKKIRDNLDKLYYEYEALLPFLKTKNYLYLIRDEDIRQEFEDYAFENGHMLKLPVIEKIMVDLRADEEYSNIIRDIDDVLNSIERLSDLVQKHDIFLRFITGYPIVHRKKKSSKRKGGGGKLGGGGGVRGRNVNAPFVVGTALTMADLALILMIYIFYIWLVTIEAMG